MLERTLSGLRVRKIEVVIHLFRVRAVRGSMLCLNPVLPLQTFVLFWLIMDNSKILHAKLGIPHECHRCGNGELSMLGALFLARAHEEARSCEWMDGAGIFRVLQICTSRYGRDEGLALLEKTGMYLGPERYTVKHMPIDVMRGSNSGREYNGTFKEPSLGFSWHDVSLSAPGITLPSGQECAFSPLLETKDS
ncbi:hypothetical protein D5086_005396 [Populus alba]|uniref:Uncharacterized protein n=1 Tax=Populus alba TaxID=43335 RepID=A0ACC4CTS5_POPAL